MTAIKAFVLAADGDLAEAAELYSSLEHVSFIDADTTVNYARVLIELNRPRDALSQLRKVSHMYAGEPRYVSFLADLCLELGHEDDCLKYVALLRTRYPAERKYAARHAIALWRFGRSSEACDVATDILDSGTFELPQNKDEFYVDGLANWILGRLSRADYDFVRSGSSGRRPYWELLAKNTNIAFLHEQKEY